jgi:hypothetical protein
MPLATQPAALIEAWVEFTETRTVFFAVRIETNSVLHQKLATPNKRSWSAINVQPPVVKTCSSKKEIP